MLITFSGLDGAGKSTLIEWLRVALEREGHPVTVLHMNDDVGVYAYVRRVRDHLLRLVGRQTPPPATARASAARNGRLHQVVRRVRNALVWSDVVRRCVYPIDLVIFALHRLALEKLTNRVFIMDRYFYDTLVDLSERHHSRWNRLLKLLTPTPDVPVLLDVPPEQAFARKGEHTVDYLARRWAAYQTILGWVPSRVRLSNVELQRAQAALWRVVRARLRGPGNRRGGMAEVDRASEQVL